MKKLFIIVSIGQLLLASNCCSSQTKNEDFASTSGYLNENDITIRQAITDNIFNLNPVEFAYALPELCQLIRENKVSIESWKFYIDSLNIKSKKVDSDTLTSNYAVNTKGLLQKQILFFIRTVNNSQEFSTKYANEIKNILKNTVTRGDEEIIETFSMIKISDVVGETNFWYFLQIEGCSLIDRVISENTVSKESLEIVSSNLNIISTFKNPYALQKRKLRDLQSRLLNSDNSFCKELSNLMNKRVITIEDKNKSYFLEHTDWHLVKTF